MEKIEIVMGDGDTSDGYGGNYKIEVDDSGITVFGCDCADNLNDSVRIAQLRNALDRWLTENVMKEMSAGSATTESSSNPVKA